MDSKYTAGQTIKFELPTITITRTAYNGTTWDCEEVDEDSAAYQEVVEFYTTHVTSRYGFYNHNEIVRPAHSLVHCTKTNMDNAQIMNTIEIVESNRSSVRHEKSFDVVDAWVIVAENGDRVINYNCNFIYTTEAEARKAFNKLKATARKEIEAAARKEQSAALARHACAKRVTDADVKAATDSSVQIGDLVPVRAMGKDRVGVVTGSTAQKWIVAFTTPSNPLEIREARVNRH